MKNLKTLAKEAEKMTYEEFKSFVTLKEAQEFFDTHVTSENFNEQISDRQKFALAIYRELAKALTVKSTDKKKSLTLELDCNYEKSKFHDSDTYKLDYFELVTSDRDRAIQFYLTCNAKKQTAYFRCCTSCKKVSREQFIALEDELHFIVQYNKKTGRAKTSERKEIDYTEIVEVAKLVLAVLNSENSADSAE